MRICRRGRVITRVVQAAGTCDLGVQLERLGLVRPAVTAYERGLITRGRLLESLGLSPFAPIDPLVEGPSV